MSGAASRNKGARGELEFAARLALALEVEAERCGQLQRKLLGSSHADVEWPGCPWWLEVKRGARVNHRAALGQAVSSARLAGDGRAPVVLARDDRAEAVVVMRFEDWLVMAAAFLRRVEGGGDGRAD